MKKLQITISVLFYSLLLFGVCYAIYEIGLFFLVVALLFIFAIFVLWCLSETDEMIKGRWNK